MLRLLAAAAAAMAATVSAEDAEGFVSKEFCGDMDIILGIGSSTVFPVAELYARRYVQEQVHPIVRSTGSSLGIRNLLGKD